MVTSSFASVDPEQNLPTFSSRINIDKKHSSSITALATTKSMKVKPNQSLILKDGSFKRLFERPPETTKKNYTFISAMSLEENKMPFIFLSFTLKEEIK